MRRGKARVAGSRSRWRRAAAAWALAAGAALLASPGAGAATITPNSFSDDFSDNSVCSLREAISIANTNSTATEPDCAVDTAGGADPLGNDVIQLAAGTYLLSLVGASENGNSTGDLDVASGPANQLTIVGAGPGATLIDTVSGWDDRVLHQTSALGSLRVGALTITGGDAPAGGGGILSAGAASSLFLEQARITGNSAAGGGGGIQAGGLSLSIVQSEVSQNTAATAGVTNGGGIQASAGTTTIVSTVIADNDAEGVNGTSGGGLSASGDSATISGSVIAGNRATNGGAAQVSGAGIRFSGDVAATVRGTTISGNELLSGLSPNGAGIHMLGAGTTLELVNSTLSDNRALGSNGAGGGLNVAGGTATVVNSTFGPNPILTANGSAVRAAGGTIHLRASLLETSGAADACTGTIITIGSGGYNVVRDLSCTLAGPDDAQGVSPLLGPLQGNGGPDAGPGGLVTPILTHAPGLASPAIDRVPALDCVDQPGPAALAVDQRGLPRPIDGDLDGVADCDSGSVELQVEPPQPPPGDATPPDTRILAGPKARVRAGRRGAAVRLRFRSTKAGSSFRCALRKRGRRSKRERRLAAFRPCRSPLRYRRLRPGRYLFLVRAIDAAGVPDPTPARRRWRVIR